MTEIALGIALEVFIDPDTKFQSITDMEFENVVSQNPYLYDCQRISTISDSEATL